MSEFPHPIPADAEPWVLKPAGADLRRAGTPPPSVEAYVYRRPWGSVTVDPVLKSVRKEYDFGDVDDSRFQASQEFDRLQRFSEVLRHTPGIRCPRPSALIEGDEATPSAVEMEWCSGEPVHDYLMRRDTRPERLPELAARIAAGLIAYVDTFGEHYADASFHNALYDVETDMLTLFDFGPWKRSSTFSRRLPLESSIGSVLGSAIRVAVLARSPRNSRRRWRQLRVAASVVTIAEAQRGAEHLVPDAIRRRAWHNYSGYTYRGRWTGQIWRRTVGAIIARALIRGYRLFALTPGLTDASGEDRNG